MRLTIKYLTLYLRGENVRRDKSVLGKCLAGALLMLPLVAAGQGELLRIEVLQQMAEKNYPLVKQFGLTELSRDYTVSNASKGYLPQLGLNARATYQSEVTQIPANMPGVTPLSKDQYQAVLEVNQTIWDGGAIESQKKIARATSETELRKSAAELYAVRERVNQLFFGILLLEEQIKQAEFLIGELTTNHKKVNAYAENGVAAKPDLDAVKVEILKAAQRKEELLMTCRTYREMLAAITGAEEAKRIGLMKPEAEGILPAGENRRPELDLFNAQLTLINSQEAGIKAATMPRLNLFVQGGYGNPGLNMLKNEFSAYYIGGVRLAWNFGSFYTKANSLKKLETGKESVKVMQETFLFNSNLAEMQQRNEVMKYAKQLQADDEIIQLRNNIKRAAEKKVENGTLSVSDLLREINAENMARQERATHEIMHLMAIYTIKYLKNN